MHLFMYMHVFMCMCLCVCGSAGGLHSRLSVEILAVGKKSGEEWTAAACEEYEKRLRPYVKATQQA
jgi:hypothetical protein